MDGLGYEYAFTPGLHASTYSLRRVWQGLATLEDRMQESIHALCGYFCAFILPFTTLCRSWWWPHIWVHWHIIFSFRVFHPRCITLKRWQCGTERFHQVQLLGEESKCLQKKQKHTHTRTVTNLTSVNTVHCCQWQSLLHPPLRKMQGTLNTNVVLHPYHLEIGDNSQRISMFEVWIPNYVSNESYIYALFEYLHIPA